MASSSDESKPPIEEHPHPGHPKKLVLAWIDAAAPMTALRLTDPGGDPSTMAVRKRPTVFRLFFFISKATSAIFLWSTFPQSCSYC